MEFKTSSAGLTTLVLDPDEEAMLRKAGKRQGKLWPNVLIEFEHLRRSNPIMEFRQLIDLYDPPRTRPGPQAVPEQDAGPDILGDLVGLDNQIRTAFRAASSMQVEAMLLQARAATLAGIAIATALQEIEDLLIVMADRNA